MTSRPSVRTLTIIALLLLGALAIVSVVALARRSLEPRVPIAAATPDRDVGVDFDHVFGKDVRFAREQWIKLAEAIPLIERFGTAPDEQQTNLNERKRAARELLGHIGHIIAEAELKEAENTPAKVTPDTLAEARNLLGQGDALWQSAIAQGDDTALVQALLRYEGVLNLLLPQLHPEFNRPRSTP